MDIERLLWKGTQVNGQVTDAFCVTIKLKDMTTLDVVIAQKFFMSSAVFFRLIKDISFSWVPESFNGVALIALDV